MTFQATTYNVLASAYLGRGDYSAVPPEVLAPERRVRALVKHIAELGSDILCLQEVEADLFLALRIELEPRGYAGEVAFKGKGKPDGCATFFRTGRFHKRDTQRVDYRDEEQGPGSHSGFIALLVALEDAGRMLGVANTHLRWDPPGTPPVRQVGQRQALELIAACRDFVPTCHAWIVAGDFNRGPASDVAATFRAAGFHLAHEGRPHIHSAVVNRRAVLIDHLFSTSALSAQPIDPPLVHDGMVLPALEQPSDHLALSALYTWGGPPKQGQAR